MSARLILSIVGARPQFIKAAAVSRAIREAGKVHEMIVHTGQHFDTDMSSVFFDEMDIPKPTHSLNINGGGHGDMTGRMMIALESIVAAERPDWVLVYGDTNSTLAGALVASKLHVAIAHVEAGLRSFNRRMPEEVNRVVVDHLSTLLFCPTQAAVRNLANEGVDKGAHHVGDVMYDAIIFAAERARNRSTILTDLRLAARTYAVATVHRAENTDDPERLAEIFEFLRARAREVPVVLPIHPRTRHAVARLKVDLRGITVIAPIGYLDMTTLLSNAATVFTDSGGLQKEAYFHRIPCVTLREETEWVETIESGWNRLWRGPEYAARRDIAEYGDGSAAKKISSFIA
jgi:UDP-GlcNAc3NAcA epimerase